MAIGTSDGEYYEDRFDYLTRSYQQANEENQGREQVPLYRGGKDVTPKEKPPLDPKGAPEGGPKGIHTDNEHHVPLIASAIMDDNDNMAGLAIDHRVKVPEEYLPHLAIHEGTELPLMQDYMADGMKEQDAYHKAHDIATAVESASVRGHAARNGLDPDAYHEQYKQFFRDAASVAGQSSGRDRHPGAHTTVYGLDESELGDKWNDMQMDHAIHLAMNDDPHKPISPDVLEGQLDKAFGGHGAGASPYKLKLQYKNEKYNGEYHMYHLYKGDEAVGELSITKYGEHAHLGGAYGIGGLFDTGVKNTLGPSAIREALRQYIKKNPEIKSIDADRVSGARSKAGSAGNIRFNVDSEGRLQLSDETKRVMKDWAQFQARRREMGYGRSDVSLARSAIQDVVDRTLRAPSRMPEPEGPREMTTDMRHAYNQALYRQEPFEDEYTGEHWQDQPLRTREGRFMNVGPDTPLEDQAVAMYHNSMRDIGLPPRSYEGSDTGRRSSLVDINRYLWRRARGRNYE